MYVSTTPQRYGWTETDGQTTCRSNTALCIASRGENENLNSNFRRDDNWIVMGQRVMSHGSV